MCNADDLIKKGHMVEGCDPFNQDCLHQSCDKRCTLFYSQIREWMRRHIYYTKTSYNWVFWKLAKEMSLAGLMTARRGLHYLIVQTGIIYADRWLVSFSYYSQTQLKKRNAKSFMDGWLDFFLIIMCTDTMPKTSWTAQTDNSKESVLQ